jgi:hypothetical protein
MAALFDGYDVCVGASLLAIRRPGDPAIRRYVRSKSITGPPQGLPCARLGVPGEWALVESVNRCAGKGQTA